MTDDDAGGSDDDFEAEIAAARDLLDGEGIDAAYVGVVRDGEVDTTFAQRTADPEREGLRALALAAAHLRLVADEAGVDASTVAADAASLAERVEEIPGSTETLPDE
ncbi:hypothetical protein GCM10027435_05310 [Haloparvum alkalitolerans]|uniref:hypothetical protein n=1 Tax=Haloparvum alkalitolerans TaxID=1042953 RepID=UPI003CEFAB1F